MKEPDKIYAKIIAGSLCVSRKPDKIFGEPYPEYIRKDALLEWARENIHNGIYKYAMKEVIEKLNLM